MCIGNITDGKLDSLDKPNPFFLDFMMHRWWMPLRIGSVAWMHVAKEALEDFQKTSKQSLLWHEKANFW